MYWFHIELEIPIFGKDSRYIYAENQSDAKFIALKKASDDFKCSLKLSRLFYVKKSIEIEFYRISGGF